MFQLTSILLFSICLQVSLQDYSWKEYNNGKIPDEALVGGFDPNGEKVYIGRVYRDTKWKKYNGLMPVQIYPGVSSVNTFIPAPKKVFTFTQDIKILCGNENEFEWIPVTIHDFGVKMINRNPVIGGRTEGPVLRFNKDHNIGRIFFDGSTKIGSVQLNQLNKIVFMFVNGQTVQKADSFEVLVRRNEFMLDIRNPI